MKKIYRYRYHNKCSRARSFLVGSGLSKFDFDKKKFQHNPLHPKKKTGAATLVWLYFYLEYTDNCFYFWNTEFKVHLGALLHLLLLRSAESHCYFEEDSSCAVDEIRNS